MIKMTDLSKTLFIPLYFKYKESIGRKKIYDDIAINFFKEKPEKLKEFSEMDKDNLSFDRIISRTIIIDKIIIEILNNNSIGFIVNMGCGLDFRNRRLNLNIPWYNIDLESVIDYRNSYFSKYSDEYNISGDIFSFDYGQFDEKGCGLFIFEGILMFFSQEEVVKILTDIKSQIASNYFVIHSFPEETGNIPSIKNITNKSIIKWRMDNPKFLEKAVGIEHLEKHNLIKSNDKIDFMVNLYKY